MIKRIVDTILILIIRLLYPKDDVCSYLDRYRVSRRSLLAMGFLQKIIGFNREVPWPVHFTSIVVAADHIERPLGHSTLGWMPGCYIQAINGIHSGRMVYVGPGVKIISANHQIGNLSMYDNCNPVIIEDGCWIGANVVILPGVHLGPETVIGAGAVVTNSFPNGRCIVAGNPARLVRPL